ncbi:MAG TPA: sulfur transferase domain-containing protein [Oligoflexia bacterium]|nr:sulfur transferase domain-containing protein [Oligoflexia bacterium]HMR25229.1 sulfur transferase domain-containing protein [Oligoflexia bacterium]
MQLTTPYVFNEESSQMCSGQISPQDVPVLKQEGFAHVINLRGQDEMPSPLEEKTWFADTGIQYHHLNIASANDLSKSNVEAFSQMLANIGSEKTLVHCGSSNRVGAMYALKAYWLDGKNKEESIAIGEQAGLTSLKETVLALMA